MPLSPFSPAARGWFAESFPAPTPVQARGWQAISRGENALLLAPTGSGKTLAAFLWCIDALGRLPPDAPPGVRVLYVSPLKALVYDIDRNLRAPLVGISRVAARVGSPLRSVRVDMRTGDTAQRDRRQQARDPADILVTTPESLYLLLTSGARETLRSVETVIVDEIHTMAPTKRGAHLSLSLERLARITHRDPQRIGLSATQRPLEAVAAWLGGDRPVTIVDASERPLLDLEIVVPVADMDRPAPEGAPPEERASIWPAMHPELLALVRAHRSTLLFVNNRGLCERLAQSLNELAGEDLVQAHHGSISHARRAEIEEALKAGRLRGLVATSSLELGIDMGAVDLVVMVASPGSVASGLQRAGRAGHSVGETSRARLFPKWKGDLLECAVVARRMLEGEVEPMRVPRNALDVLAQQVVAMCAMDDWRVADLLALARRAHGFRELPESALAAVLDMLSGRYPSDEFADLRPRVHWDREADTLVARKGARSLAVLNAGTIPDRGLFGVFLGVDGPRVGELDEEMVYESRAGDVILLGASSWRIEQITRDRVLVSPAPGEPGRLPFWKGEGPGRPVDLGRAIGAFVRELDEAEGAPEALAEAHRLDRHAAANLAAHVRAQREATGTLPTDRAITIERFRDELGDWRVCVHSPFGARVNRPWALAIEATLARRAGFDVHVVANDEGIVLRVAEGDELPETDLLVPDPDLVEELVTEQLQHSPLFAARFRENAARALLLPRRGHDRRVPLWAQRLRSQALLAVAMRHQAFPVVLETYRECLQDIFDLPALVDLLRAIRRREIRVEPVETSRASPFARTLVFTYVASYLYELDAPLAERRAHALSIDRELLRELLGREVLRDLLDAGVIDEVEAELQGLAPDRRARHADALHDLLRRVGDLSAGELDLRCEGDGAAWVLELVAARRAVRIRVCGEDRWVGAEDAAWFRDALGVALPPGIPAVFREAVADPIARIAGRWARTHGPFVTGALARRYGLLVSRVEPVLLAMERDGRLVRGELRPGGTEREWCDPEVLRQVRRRTLAKLRGEVAPVEAATLARFLPAWHGVGTGRHRLGRLEEVVAQLEGLPLPISVLEDEILAPRLGAPAGRMLDEAGSAGEIAWVGHGPLGASDGLVALYRRERVRLLLDPPVPFESTSAVHDAILGRLEERGASFFADLVAAAKAPAREVQDALWDLVWAGHVTNDTFQPLRELRARSRKAARRPLSGGRWVAVAHIAGTARTETERAHARAVTLLERHGVLTREAVLAEGAPGGFAPVYAVLTAMEASGKVRRGYFVEGLGGAQFALPGAVDRLRAEREGPGDPAVLAAVDPANPYGAALPWPETRGEARPRRVGGALVVSLAGRPLLYLEAGGRGLLTFAGFEGDDAARAIEALRAALRRLRKKSLLLTRVDGLPAADSPLAEMLVGTGFVREYRGLWLDVPV